VLGVSLEFMREVSAAVERGNESLNDGDDWSEGDQELLAAGLFGKRVFRIELRAFPVMFPGRGGTMKKEPDSDSEKPLRLGIPPAALGYLSLLVIPVVALGAG
jgi:hypothetical protein